jgi:hypothetical protein
MVPFLLALLFAGQKDEQTLAAPSALWHEPHRWTEHWSPTDITQQVLRDCSIDAGLYSVEREDDGRARVQRSPDLTSDQQTCAAKMLAGQQIQDRDQPAPLNWIEREGAAPH